MLQHCLKGWNTTQPAMVPASSNIALRDATTGIKSSMKTVSHLSHNIADFCLNTSFCISLK